MATCHPPCVYGGDWPPIRGYDGQLSSAKYCSELLERAVAFDRSVVVRMTQSRDGQKKWNTDCSREGHRVASETEIATKEIGSRLAHSAGDTTPSRSCTCLASGHQPVYIAQVLGTEMSE